ncbi:hypothetical protein H2248_012014 [Termitomyces sp. 'cryptogamus']|nr:hypothetical protein H2248_012014 [Termitomyces sp. 'cryptogamus']
MIMRADERRLVERDRGHNGRDIRPTDISWGLDPLRLPSTRWLHSGVPMHGESAALGASNCTVL